MFVVICIFNSQLLPCGLWKSYCWKITTNVTLYIIENFHSDINLIYAYLFENLKLFK